MLYGPMSTQVKAQVDDASEDSAAEGTAEPELPAEAGCAFLLNHSMHDQSICAHVLFLFC